MKFTILSIFAIVAPAFVHAGFGQTPAEPIVKVRGCLLGNGSNENPWSLHSVVLPSPPSTPAAAPGARGDGGARGAGGAGRGDGAGQGRGAAGAGRGGDGGRGAAPAAPPQPPVDLRLTGIDMSPWHNMFVEVEGKLGPRPASGDRKSTRLNSSH